MRSLALLPGLLAGFESGTHAARQAQRAARGESPAPHRVSGNVLNADGSPAAGARVETSAGGQAVTAADGSFTLWIELPLDTASIEVTALADEPDGQGTLAASALVVPSAFAPSSSAGPLSLSLSPSCHPRWLPTFGAQPGIDGTVFALATFDDGNGPALYAAGSFLGAAGRPVDQIARWDGGHWSGLGSVGDPGGGIVALAVFDDGSGPALYAGGSFTSVGGVAARSVARWDGTSWTALGAGISGSTAQVKCLAVFDDGSGPALYAGGDFTSAGGVPANRIAKWDGASWSALGSGVGTGNPGAQAVRALAVFDDGSGSALYAAGNFTVAGGLSAGGIARWDGASWSIFGARGLAATQAEFVAALAVHDDGDGPALFAGGKFDVTSNMARWDGTRWLAVGSGTELSSEVFALAAYDDGSGPALYVGGTFTSAGGIDASRLARWDGSSWSEVGGGTSLGVRALAVLDDGGGESLVVGGEFGLAGGVLANHVARWNGSSWGTFGGDPDAIDASVFALARFDDGSGEALYAGGHFAGAGGQTLNGIGKLAGSSWEPLGSGLGGPVPEVHALAAFDDGSGPALYAGGDFTLAGGTPALRVARWDGASWSALGPGFTQTVHALIAFDDGGGPRLYAGVGFGSGSKVARWDGANWSMLGSGMSGSVDALAVFDDGSGAALYAGGAFASAGGVAANRIARWDGTSWSALGTGLGGLTPQVLALAVFDDGSGPALYAGGVFNTAGGVTANRVARWDGVSWSTVGSGMGGYGVFALAVHDDGRGPALYAGGLVGKRIARWSGSDWLALAPGMDDAVRAVLGARDGRGLALFAGGDFDASPAGDAHLARWACRPATLR